MSERRILIAVDGSKHSEAAFEWYCKNIHQEGDALILIHSLELPPKPPTPFPYAEKPFDEWRQQIECIREDSRTMLTKFQHRCDEKNIDSLKVQDERYTPGPTICKVAKENEVALIVLGSRGLTKMRRTILGSVSDYVVHNSHLPVCVVCDENSNSLNKKDPILRQNTAPPKLRHSCSSISDSSSHQELNSSP